MGLLDLYNDGQTQLNQIFTDFITGYRGPTTGTPSTTANPGGPKQFHQNWASDNTYLDANPIVGIDSGVLKSSDNITNLDVSDPGVDGGIPYKQDKDPTIYRENVNGSSPIRGYFATPGAPAKKFTQTFNENNTYLNFIKNYI